MTKLLLLAAGLAAPAPLGASAARIFEPLTRHSPRIAHEAPNDLGALQAEFKAVSADLTKVVGEVKGFAEKAKEEIAGLGKMHEETKGNADKALTQMGELRAQLTDIEQKLARPGGGQPERPKSLGETVVGNDETKALLDMPGVKRGRARVQVDTKAILSATATWGATASVGNALVAPDRAPMVALPMRTMTVRDLVAPGETSSNAIEYAVQTGFTNNAAVVAENTTKPVSDITFDLESAAVRTIAHTAFASRQILDDAPMLRTFIDAQMRYGLEYAEEAEILYGDGTGQHLLGIIPQATAYAAPFVFGAGETALDRLRLAVLQSTLALLPPSGIVLHPTDWAKLETLKDAQGRYLIGDPMGMITPRVWGLPVVASMAMTAGTYVTGAFRTAAQLFDRMAIEVLISTEDGDNFKKNMVTIRAEERVALAVYRPAAFITGTLP
jgi:HK97 family phage major capsid protein